MGPGSLISHCHQNIDCSQNCDSHWSMINDQGRSKECGQRSKRAQNTINTDNGRSQCRMDIVRNGRKCMCKKNSLQLGHSRAFSSTEIEGQALGKAPHTINSQNARAIKGKRLHEDEHGSAVKPLQNFDLQLQL